jgi:hypothetical protein
MRICARVEPVEQRPEPGRRVLCWLHGPEEAMQEDDGRRLEREAIAVAEEA